MIESLGEKSIQLYVKNILSELFPDYCFNDTKNISVISEISKDKKDVTVKLNFGSQPYIEKEPLSEHINEKIATTIAAGKAAIKYAMYMGKNPPPYGVLTGVRPFKIASNLLSCYNNSDVKEILKKKFLIREDKLDLLLSVAKKDMEAKEKHLSNDCSVYISIPFCPSRCNYCSFISSAAPSQLNTIDTYLDALISEIRLFSDFINRNSLNIKSVYIGGGTPTILDEIQLNRLISSATSLLPFKNLKEFTVEAGRPDTITDKKLEVLKTHGVNRICVNCQTTNDKVLKVIGRSHTKNDFFNAFEKVKSYNFATINTDIIAGLESDDLDSFKNTVNDVIILSPDSITVHTLSLKKSSNIKRQNYLSTDYSMIDECIKFSKNVCISLGYLPYYLYRQKYSVGNHENIGYAKASHESHYNIAMMNEIEHVFGVGAGATSRIVNSLPDGKIAHFENYKYPNEYIKSNDKIYKNMIEMGNLICGLKNS